MERADNDLDDVDLDCTIGLVPCVFLGVCAFLLPIHSFIRSLKESSIANVL